MREQSGGSRGLFEHAWVRRPVLSNSLRIAVVVIPIGLSLGLAVLLSRVLPPASTAASLAVWVAVIIAASLLTLLAFEPAARRLLPLAALLDVSLLFPDRTPARFVVARRAGSPKDLRERLGRAVHDGAADDARRLQTILELGLALSVHDRATRGHSERVRVFTDLIAAELDIGEADRARLRWAAILHDIGKLEVAPAILRKGGRPSEEEWAALHRHPEDGARLIAPLIDWLGEWGPAVAEHHERFDGTGYPHGIRGADISLGARIVAVADCYEVMTGPRTYKRPMSVPAAREELVRVAGTQLDPHVVRAFLNVSVGRLWRAIGLGAWVAQIPVLGRLLSVGGSWVPSFTAAAAGMTVITLTPGFGAHPGLAGPQPAAVEAVAGPPAAAPAAPPGWGGSVQGPVIARMALDPAAPASADPGAVPGAAHPAAVAAASAPAAAGLPRATTAGASAATDRDKDPDKGRGPDRDRNRDGDDRSESGT